MKDDYGALVAERSRVLRRGEVLGAATAVEGARLGFAGWRPRRGPAGGAADAADADVGSNGSDVALKRDFSLDAVVAAVMVGATVGGEVGDVDAMSRSGACGGAAPSFSKDDVAGACIGAGEGDAEG